MDFQSRIKNIIDSGISTARSQDCGFFECRISTEYGYPRLSDGGFYDKNADVMCRKMFENFEISEEEFEEIFKEEENFKE